MLALLSIILISIAQSYSQNIIHTNDLNFRVDPGGRTCFFETGKRGNMMEVYYQVVDGQHGDLDISLDVIDPQGVKIISDFKKMQNVIIRDLELDGDYTFCLDNTFSSYNSKLVFIYVLMETMDDSDKQEAIVTTIDENGNEVNHIEVLKWQGTDENDQEYFVEVEAIADSLSRTLKRVLKARRLLDLYNASKSRDAYRAFESTFVVDMWSSYQITFMFVVGMIQVYMIKKLFKNPK